MVVMTYLVQVTYTRMVDTRLTQPDQAGEHRHTAVLARTRLAHNHQPELVAALFYPLPPPPRNYSIYNSYPQFNRLFIHFRQNPAATVDVLLYQEAKQEIKNNILLFFHQHISKLNRYQGVAISALIHFNLCTGKSLVF